MTVGVEVDLVGSPGRTDIEPRLVVISIILLEVQGFADALTHLQNTQVDVIELWEILQIVGALPALYIGICHACGVVAAHTLGKGQQLRVQNRTVVEQGCPDDARE